MYTYTGNSHVGISEQSRVIPEAEAEQSSAAEEGKKIGKESREQKIRKKEEGKGWEGIKEQ